MPIDLGSLPPEGRVDPNRVRFSQHSAAWTFKDGRTVGELAEGLRADRIHPENVEPIRVLVRDGRLWTLDNCRLAAFRRAGVAVPYRLATIAEEREEDWKFTTRNEGTSIILRGEPR